MEPSKKTTILLPPDLHEQLTRQAAREKTSLGELVRRACREEYGSRSTEDRRRAVAELLSLELPVASPEEMKRESVPTAEDLVPTTKSSRRTRAGSRSR
jgi:hypothetical protein